nr:hypothetical protein BaRGS_004089 [Batillaria attramentaria]
MKVHDALFGGNISGRRLRGVKVNPIYQENDLAGRPPGHSTDTQSESALPIGEIQIEMYESLPRNRCRPFRQYNSAPVLKSPARQPHSPTDPIEDQVEDLDLGQDDVDDSVEDRKSAGESSFMNVNNLPWTFFQERSQTRPREPMWGAFRDKDDKALPDVREEAGSRASRAPTDQSHDQHEGDSSWSAGSRRRMPSTVREDLDVEECFITSDENDIGVNVLEVSGEGEPPGDNSPSPRHLPQGDSAGSDVPRSSLYPSHSPNFANPLPQRSPSRSLTSVRKTLSSGTDSLSGIRLCPLCRRKLESLIAEDLNSAFHNDGSDIISDRSYSPPVCTPSPRTRQQNHEHVSEDPHDHVAVVEIETNRYPVHGGNGFSVGHTVPVRNGSTPLETCPCSCHDTPTVNLSVEHETNSYYDAMDGSNRPPSLCVDDTALEDSKPAECLRDKHQHDEFNRAVPSDDCKKVIGEHCIVSCDDHHRQADHCLHDACIVDRENNHTCYLDRENNNLYSEPCRVLSHGDEANCSPPSPRFDEGNRISQVSENSDDLTACHKCSCSRYKSQQKPGNAKSKETSPNAGHSPSKRSHEGCNEVTPVPPHQQNAGSGHEPDITVRKESDNEIIMLGDNSHHSSPPVLHATCCETCENCGSQYEVKQADTCKCTGNCCCALGALHDGKMEMTSRSPSSLRERPSILTNGSILLRADELNSQSWMQRYLADTQNLYRVHTEPDVSIVTPGSSPNPSPRGSQQNLHTDHAHDTQTQLQLARSLPDVTSRDTVKVIDERKQKQANGSGQRACGKTAPPKGKEGKPAGKTKGGKPVSSIEDIEAELEDEEGGGWSGSSNRSNSIVDRNDNYKMKLSVIHMGGTTDDPAFEMIVPDETYEEESMYASRRRQRLREMEQSPWKEEPTSLRDRIIKAAVCTLLFCLFVGIFIGVAIHFGAQEVDDADMNGSGSIVSGGSGSAFSVHGAV